MFCDLIRSLLCCGSRPSQTDNEVTEEEAILVPAIRAQAKVVEGIAKKLEEETAVLEQLKGMRGRSSAQFSRSEQDRYKELMAPKPFGYQLPHLAASSAQPAAGVRYRDPVSNNIRQAAKDLNDQINQQKYVNGGVKLGNWDKVKERQLAHYLGQLAGQNLDEAAIIQVLNALPKETRQDFIDIGFPGLKA